MESLDVELSQREENDDEERSKMCCSFRFKPVNPLGPKRNPFHSDRWNPLCKKHRTGYCDGFLTLWPLLVLIALVEYALNFSLQIVSPEHSMHLSSFCTACGVDDPVLFMQPGAEGGGDGGGGGGGGGGPSGPGGIGPALSADDDYLYLDSTDLGYGLGSKRDFVMSCIADGVLGVMGVSYQAFVQQFIATLIGHVLLLYAMIAAHDAMVAFDWHNFYSYSQTLGYSVLCTDVLLEIMIMLEIELPKPREIMESNRYRGCSADFVTQIDDNVDTLEEIGVFMIYFRMASGVLVTMLYILGHPVKPAERELQAKRDAEKQRLLREKGEEDAAAGWCVQQ